MAIKSAGAALVAAVAALNDDQLSALSDAADSSCTNGYDNDGSTGYEIFENGFDLALKAEGRDVVAVEGDESTYFFIGTEEDALAAVARVVEENPSDEDEDEA